ncbi:hypothetical protein [Yinghuangia seranimata]|uniref:hypothetical protein n=1 Tax=Yinghuangia seranimata TaxID=408067 RepID=UPI00248B05DE|nr:hypothetical protein [Yinghuangia seranimata]MDI2131596.1 hypothetical protein [Yinghuangia seranimata]
MSENPVADGSAEAIEAPPAPGRNPRAWLLVAVLVTLFAVLAYAVVMVVRMLA